MVVDKASPYAFLMDGDRNAKPFGSTHDHTTNHSAIIQITTEADSLSKVVSSFKGVIASTDP